MTDWFRLKLTSGSHLVQCPCSSRAMYSRQPRTMSGWFLNISNKGYPTASQGNLYQCSVTFTEKKCFLIVRWNVLCFSLFTLLVVLSLDTTEKSLTLSSFHFSFRYFYTVMSYPFEPSFLWAKCSQPFPLWQVIQPLYHFCHSLWTFMAGLFSVCPHLSCSEEPRTGHGTPGLTNAEWRERITLISCWQHSS